MPTDNNKTGSINKLPEVTENGLFNTGWPNFKLASIATQYSMAKLFAYLAAPLYEDGARLIDKHILKNVVKYGSDGKSIASPAARKYVGVIEAVGFSLISLTSFFLESNNFKHNIYDAMAAERGMNPEKVSVFTMYKSHNPFIRSLRDRFTLENALRIPGSILFAKNIKAGIVALSLDFTLERSIFVENNAFDMLRNMLYEVQKLKTNGPDDTQRLYIGLQRAVQRALADNHRGTLSEAQLQANKAVFDRLTQNIMTSQFHINEAVYILGEMANHPGSTDKLLSDLGKIEQVGLKGFACQKALLANGKSPVNAVLAQGKRSFVQMSAVAANLQPGVA